MSFGTYARKVRDPALEHGRRVTALAGCVSLYRPLGHRATWAYLARVAGDLRRDPDALVRAVDVVAASRSLWLAEVDAYTAARRAAKLSGRRHPTPPGPFQPLHWYGDRRTAAETALDVIRRRAARNRPVRGGAADPAVLRLTRVNPADLPRLRAAHAAEPDSRWVLHLLAEVTAG